MGMLCTAHGMYIVQQYCTNFVRGHMVTRHDDDSIIRYIYVELLCCTLETYDIVCQLSKKFLKVHS